MPKIFKIGKIKMLNKMARSMLFYSKWRLEGWREAEIRSFNEKINQSRNLYSRNQNRTWGTQNIFLKCGNPRLERFIPIFFLMKGNVSVISNDSLCNFQFTLNSFV